MTGKRIGYIRVSTLDQNPERQLDGIQLDKKFIDHASGATIKRPQLELLMDYVREEDIVLVHSMDRMARNVKDLRNIIDHIISRGGTVQFIKENLTFSGIKSPMSDLMLYLMGAVAEFELARIQERQREGIAIAMKKGKYKGGHAKIAGERLEVLKQRLKTPGTKSAIAREFCVSRFTLYNYIKKIDEQQQQEKTA